MPEFTDKNLIWKKWRSLDLLNSNKESGASPSHMAFFAYAENPSKKKQEYIHPPRDFATPKEDLIKLYTSIFHKISKISVK